MGVHMINDFGVRSVYHLLFIMFLAQCMVLGGVAGHVDPPFSCNIEGNAFDEVAPNKEIVSRVPSNGLMDSAWPMFQHDQQHTGRTEVVLPPGNQAVLKWRYLSEPIAENRSQHSTPVIDKDGVIYYGNFFGYLHAVYPNGTMKWASCLSSFTEQTGAIASDGTIYYGDYHGMLSAVNPNGTIKWQVQLTEYDMESSPVISDDGTIYIGADGNKQLFAVNPSGTIQWVFQTNGSLRAPALDTQGNLYIGSGDGFFYSLYPNGTLRWKTEFGFVCGGKGPVIDHDETVYFASAGKLYAMNAENGTVIWVFDSGYWSSSGSPAVGFNGELYYGCGIYKTNESGAFFCVNPNGTLRWKYPLTAYCVASPVVTGGGVIIIGDNEGYVYAFSSEGVLLWRYFTSRPIYSSFAVAEDGTIYFTSWDGLLHAITVVERENHPPETPVLVGPTNGKAGAKYPYTFNLTDSDGDPMFFYMEYGDGAYSWWTGSYESGEQIIEELSWMYEGTYTLRVKARDLYCAESDWGTLTITMPTSYNMPMHWFWERFLERFPNAFPILRHLLGY